MKVGGSEMGGEGASALARGGGVAMLFVWEWRPVMDKLRDPEWAHPSMVGRNRESFGWC